MADAPTVVFLIAHPDDVAYSFGGTALLLQERCRLQVICASRGERGYSWTGQGMPPPSTELARTREGEERAACAQLDAGLDFLDLIDGEILPGRAAVARATELLATMRPAVVFTHGPDEKPDHASVWLIARQAIARAGIDCEVHFSVRHGENRCPRWSDAAFVDITTVIERKRTLIAAHRTQCPDAAHLDGVLERNRILGRMVGCAYAEAYSSLRPGPRSLLSTLA